MSQETVNMLSLTQVADWLGLHAETLTAAETIIALESCANGDDEYHAGALMGAAVLFFQIKGSGATNLTLSVDEQTEMGISIAQEMLDAAAVLNRIATFLHDDQRISGKLFNEVAERGGDRVQVARNLEEALLAERLGGVTEDA